MIAKRNFTNQNMKGIRALQITTCFTITTYSQFKTSKSFACLIIKAKTTIAKVNLLIIFKHK